MLARKLFADNDFIIVRLLVILSTPCWESVLSGNCLDTV